LTDQELDTVLGACSPEAQRIIEAVSRVMMNHDVTDEVGAEALAGLLATLPEDLGTLLHNHLARLLAVRAGLRKKP